MQNAEGNYTKLPSKGVKCENLQSHLKSLKCEADSDEDARGQADINPTFQGGVEHCKKHHHQYHHNLPITWSQEVHTSKGDRCDGNVAEEEHGVGHAQRGQQQVEHIVHLSAEVEVVENGS